MTDDATSPPPADDRPEPADEVVRYTTDGPVAVVTMNRPRYANAQNSAMTYALDDAFARAADDDDVRVVVLAGAGRHFSAGHDIGTPGRDIDRSFPAGPGCGGTTSARPARRAASPASPRCTSVCAGAGGNSPSRPSRWCRAHVSPAA